MPLDLANYEEKAADAIKAFWGNRGKAKQKQIEAGKIDRGERGGVTGGNNLDGFVALLLDLVRANGLSHADIHIKSSLVTLPGYFRPTKKWDLVVIHKKRLVAAIELKSQVGPSFGNNYNNRTEEAIGTAQCFKTAFRENAFGPHPQPFTGWLIVVEDAPKSRSLVRNTSKHYPVFPAFQKTSYLQRYDVLCQRLVQEQLYTAAAVIATPRDGINSGAYVEMSAITGLKPFVAAFAAHIAMAAAM